MPLYAIGGAKPQLQDGAWAAPSADLIGDVRLAARASVWFGAVIESDCIVGAGALVTEGKTFPSGSLIVGSPARPIRPLTDTEKQALRVSAAHYAEKAERYAEQLRRL
jgi:carbonic anhydrase/acetyltransferase-like protein (isoleucine patch superfamily)